MKVGSMTIDQKIISIYIFGIVSWVIMIGILNYRYQINKIPFFWLIFLIPIIIFLANIYFISKRDIDENDSLVTNDNSTLLIGLGPVFPLFFLIFGDKFKNDASYKGFVTLMIFGFLMTILATYVVWTPRKTTPLTTHVKTIPYTFAVTFFLMSMIYFFGFVRKY